jgi:predicted MFS family arabinose efflux permease
VRLALYGFLIGAGWSAVFTYLPDYAQNALGWSPPRSGLLIAVAGLCGMAGRIGWSRVAEQRLGAPTTLMTLAAIGLVAVCLILLAARVPALLWAGAAALGASSGSWNAVGMLAVIDRMPSGASGAASGVVMFGFLTGLAAGAPPFGWAVDVSGSYVAGLLAVIAVHVMGFMVARTLRRTIAIREVTA